MILSWLISAAILGVLIAIGASFVLRLAARRGLPRRWVALALMVFSLLLPVTLAIARRPAPMTQRLAKTSVALMGVSVRPVQHPVDANAIVMIAWAVMSIGLLGVLALSHRRAKAELAACRQYHIMGTAVALSRDFGPAAVGLIRPQVVLPEWVLDLPHAELQLVLRHEIEHLRAGDQLVLFTGLFLTVLMPWNIGLWWQLRRLRVAMEVDCDARVTPIPGDRPRYAQLLLRARSPRPQHRLVLALAPAPSALAERLMALLDRARPSPSRVALWAVSALACALVVTRVQVPSLLPAVARAKSAAAVVPPKEVALTPPPKARAADAPRTNPPIHRRAVLDSAAPVVTNAPTHPRYDSLVPYVPGPPGAVRGVRLGLGRGTFVGNGRGAATVGAARMTLRDSSQY